MRRTALVSTLLLPALLHAQDPDYATLVADFERAAKVDAATAVEQFVPRFAKAAAAQRGKDAAVPLLGWIVRHGRAGKATFEALDTLAAEHTKSLELGPVIEVLPHLATYGQPPACTTLLDAVLTAGSPPELEARALLARATLALMRPTGGDEAQVTAAASDLDKARKLTKDPALAATLQRVTAEPRGLQEGDRLPEIAGFDLDGAPMRLSDHRGKVVAVVFWADWCGPCRAMIPHERTLVERLKDKPFALVGVNCDPDVGKIRPRLVADKVTWRSIWNGPEVARGGIVANLAVRAFPTIYVLDAEGVIRKTNVRGEAMDRAVDELLAELAAKVK